MTCRASKNKSRPLRALVTGVSKGLGQHICMELLAKDYDVVGISRTCPNHYFDIESLDSFSSELCDLTNPQSVQSSLDRILAKGGIDVLINNAGILHVEGFLEQTYNFWSNTFALNVEAPMLIAQRVLPAMLKNKFGRIINIGSSSAYNGGRETSAYCASKHALLGLSRSLHDEFKGRGVYTTFVAPASMKTPMGHVELPKPQDYETFIEPSEVAKFITNILEMNDSAIVEEVRLNRLHTQ